MTQDKAREFLTKDSDLYKLFETATLLDSMSRSLDEVGENAKKWTINLKDGQGSLPELNKTFQQAKAVRHSHGALHCNMSQPPPLPQMQLSTHFLIPCCCARFFCRSLFYSSDSFPCPHLTLILFWTNYPSPGIRECKAARDVGKIPRRIAHRVCRTRSV